MKDSPEPKLLCVDTFAFTLEHSGKGPDSSPDVLIDSRRLPLALPASRHLGLLYFRPPICSPAESF